MCLLRLPFLVKFVSHLMQLKFWTFGLFMPWLPWTYFIWFLRYCFLVAPWSHKSHKNLRFSWNDFLWVLRLSSLVKSDPHRLHLKELSESAARIVWWLQQTLLSIRYPQVSQIRSLVALCMTTQGFSERKKNLKIERWTYKNVWPKTKLTVMRMSATKLRVPFC